MDENKLHEANNTLQQQETARSGKTLWLIIGIVIGIIVVVIFLIFWVLRNSTNILPETYPYIPTPKNTIRSASYTELLSNILLDGNDTGIDYSVISRLEIIDTKI